MAEIKRYDEQVMQESFSIDPLHRVSYGSLSHVEHTIYLVKKNNREYARLTHFEVLNTEIRGLLFKHSYGYDMTLVDFGKLQAL